MYVYGKTKKTLNLTFAEQTTIRQRERERLKNIRNGQNRCILHERNKETESKYLD